MIPQLRRRVRRAELRSVLAQRRRRDDAPATAATHQQWSEHPQDVGGTGEVYIDLVVPVGIRHVQNRLERLDTDVREGDVNAAPLLHNRVGGGANRIDVALIGDMLHPTATGRCHQFACVGEVFDTAPFLKSRMGLTRAAMSMPATSAPARANATSAARPIPRAAPVTTAIRPVGGRASGDSVIE